MASVEVKEWPTLGMTLDEAATALRVDRKTMIALLKNTDFPGRKVGRSWRIDPDAVKKWLDGRDPKADARAIIGDDDE